MNDRGRAHAAIGVFDSGIGGLTVARALLHGRYAATRDDVRALAAPVLRHRLLLSFAAEAEQRSADDVIEFVLRSVPYPA